MDLLKDSVNLERRVLLVDPDGVFGQILEGVLGPGYLLRRVSTVAEGIGELDSADLDAILLNFDLPTNGPASAPCTLLQTASERPAAPPVIVYSWDSRHETAMEAFECGAADLLEQPLDIRELKFAIDAACRRFRIAHDLAAAREGPSYSRIESLLGNSKAMERVSALVRKVADVGTTVLITGESGTGKGAAAHAIHQLSPRADRSFVAFSPCALPESLIEDELFGHEKGAFTGASQARRGRFEEANGGTIFLDEIGELAPSLQAKLLRVLQERLVERLGSNVGRPIDVRVICATSRNLDQMVKDGTFREDLYFRISVLRIHMPPLRDRSEDIPLLAEHFLRLFATDQKKHTRGFTPAFLSALVNHIWPGNVRELQNVVERSLVLANGSLFLGADDLPPELRQMTISDEEAGVSFHDAIRNFKRQLIRSALRAQGGNRLRAAQELRISRCYLHRLLKQLNVQDATAAEEEISPRLASDLSGAMEAGKRLGFGTQTA